MTSHDWPELRLEEWRDTYATLHMWTQIVGKIRLALAPLVNHWWNVPLYVSGRGLTTSAMPYKDSALEIEFDFIDHRLSFRQSDGSLSGFALKPMSVAAFYDEVMRTLREIGVDTQIWPVAVEVENPIPFKDDHDRKSYDREYAHRHWQALVRMGSVFEEFRAGFIGKSSPVHFFWGGFDMAVTRFSGRKAPERPEADVITREGYSHEVISHGFWPGVLAPGGDPRLAQPLFYCYSAPEPAGFPNAIISPSSAFYSDAIKNFVLPYDVVRTSHSPRETLLDFMSSTYDAAADLAKWDRAALERAFAEAPLK